MQRPLRILPCTNGSSLPLIPAALAALMIAIPDVPAETGMCLITRMDGWGAPGLMVGPIHRIDIIDDAVQDTTNRLVYGGIPRFSPDGTQFCYFKNGDNTVAIATIDGEETRTFGCDALPGNGGRLTWTNYGIWVGLDGRIVKYDTLGNYLTTYTTAQYEVRGMVSRNEISACGVYINGIYRPRLYQMRSHTTVNPPIDTDGCSTAPSPNGLLFTNNLLQSPTGNGIHRTMRILDTLGNLYQDRYFDIQDITKFSDPGYHIDSQTWSGNSNEWIIIPAGEGGSDITDNESPCLYNIVTEQQFCLKDNTGTNHHWRPNDYYSGWAPSTTDPTLALSPSMLSFAADSGGANPTSQNITASTPTGALEGLSVSGEDSWLTVDPSSTSGSSISLVNSIDIGGLIPGTYRDTITVNTTNAGGDTYYVTLELRRPVVVRTLTSVSVSPAKYTVPAGSSIDFLATCKDQNGAYFSAGNGPDVSWWTSGGGTIDQTTGCFAAASSPVHGPHLVVATASDDEVTVRDSAWIMVSRALVASVHRRIDCGTATTLPTGWETDDDYVSGGSDGSDLSGVTVSGVKAAAPSAIYTTRRAGSPHSYTVAQLIPDPYTVRLHFADPQSTQRFMNYSIQGSEVLRDFSIATLAVGANTALAMDFPAVVQDQAAGVTIDCSASSGEVFEAGFELMQEFLRPVTLVSPHGGQSFGVDETVQIVFRTDTLNVRQIYVELSTDNGRSYDLITGDYGLLMDDFGASWGAFDWTIPDSLETDSGKVSTVSSDCRIRIRPYTINIGGYDRSDSSFEISHAVQSARDAGSSAIPDHLSSARSHGRLTIEARSGSPFTVGVYAISGACLFQQHATGSRRFSLPRPPGQGVLLVRMTSAGGKVVVRRLLLH